ncbi:MAG: DUF2959 domain-containing protein [Verrucomicrobiota bacterium]
MNPLRTSLSAILALGFLTSALTLTSCSTVYYEAMDKVGVHKRDILVGRVEKARNAQEDTKEQFRDALEEFSALTNFNGGDLQSRYNQLNGAYEASEAKANAVKKRNDDVENVARALFREWDKELEQYTNASLRQSSASQKARTERRYERLMSAMRRAEAKIDPVLRAFRDQVLYLKHNLNARAIAALQSELNSVEMNVARLIREMESSIAEADRFISTMAKER